MRKEEYVKSHACRCSTPLNRDKNSAFLGYKSSSHHGARFFITKKWLKKKEKDGALQILKEIKIKCRMNLVSSWTKIWKGKESNILVQNLFKL